MFYTLRQHSFASRTIVRKSLTLALVAWIGIAHAKIVATDAEMRLLPRYCPYTKWFETPTGYSSETAKYWRSVMGESFMHMHHHCWALLKMARSQKAHLSQQERMGHWESALNDYEYVIMNSPPDFIMLPEIYTKIGEVALLLKQLNKANTAFAHARDLKPDYWPAYSHWAEFLIKTGKRDEALRIVTSGLQQSPNVRVLLELYRILSGKPYETSAKSADKVEEMVDNSTEINRSEQRPSSPGEAAVITEDLTFRNSQRGNKSDRTAD